MTRSYLEGAEKVLPGVFEVAESAFSPESLPVSISDEGRGQGSFDVLLPVLGLEVAGVDEDPEEAVCKKEPLAKVETQVPGASEPLEKLEEAPVEDFLGQSCDAMAGHI